MKKVLFPNLILALGLLLFYPFAPGSALSKIQSDLKTIGRTEADYRQELSQKLEEIEKKLGE